MLLVVAVLALLPPCWRGLRAIPRRQKLVYAGIGALVALHWLTFYGAIKLSNASIGATCMALATVFIAIIEPWLAKRPFSRRELLLGILVVPGVALVAGGVAPGMRAGIAVGAVSALFVGLFGSLNKRYAGHHDPLAVTALELGAGIVLLTVLSPLMPWLFPAFAGDPFALPGPHDFGFLLVLALACTLFPFALSLVALRHISAFAAQLAVNLEPVYAIVLAALLLGEQRELTPMFYLGVAIILGAVLLHPWLSRPRALAHPETLATSEAKGVAE
jgi:drug/metabolite transporter (DMT)-like permease